MRLASTFAVLLAPALAFAQAAPPKPALPAAPPAAPPKTVPHDNECQPLPTLSQLHIPPNELLNYDIDVLTANAARMEVETLPKANGLQPIRVRIKTTTFFNKIRRVKAEAKSYLFPKTLRPARYTEDAFEDDDHKVAEVDFASKNLPAQSVAIRYATNPKPGQALQQVYGRYSHDALDELGAIYYLRSIDLKAGMPICFDVYAMRKMFRVWGKVEGIEHVSTPAGEFNAFHVSGTAARLDKHEFQRELHVWISADDKRIPVGAVGGIDLGPVRATLTHIGQPGGEALQSHAQGLDW